jgi:hypothetical protein
MSESIVKVKVEYLVNERDDRHARRSSSQTSSPPEEREKKRLCVNKCRDKWKPEVISGKLGMSQTLLTRMVPPKYASFHHYHHGRLGFKGGQERCKNTFGVSVWNVPYNKLKTTLEENEGLDKEVGMGLDNHVMTPMYLREPNNRRGVVLAIKVTNIDHWKELVPDTTLLGMWLRKQVTDHTRMDEFLSLESPLGNSFVDCIPKKESPSKQAKTRGQTVLQEGTMITAKFSNSYQNFKDGHGNLLMNNQYQVTRSEMGGIGSCPDIRCKEFLSPALPLVERVFQAWPEKLHLLPQCVQDAFDGSKYLSYLNMLVTIGSDCGDGTKSRAVMKCLKKWPFLQNYHSDDAGTVTHTDVSNTPKTPCVAMMLGAYNGFDFAYPTCGTVISAPSGTIIVSSMYDLIHCVGPGYGIRITLVFCQHAVCSEMKMIAKGSAPRHLHGARRSKKDYERSQKGEETPFIEGLANFLCDGVDY